MAALMGILNVTPDSFSDGGVHFLAEHAVAAGHRMAAEGASILDVGGESTRPGSEPVALEEEVRRVLPVVKSLASSGFTVSIDTCKPEVARQACRAGATIINDVTGLRDPAMIEVAAETGSKVCLMHMRGTPRTMQSDPQYVDVVAEVLAYLLHQAEAAQRGGVRKEAIWIDPGIGFGKRVEHNLLLLRHLDRFVATGYPVLLGVSRKSFIGTIVGGPSPAPLELRLEGTLAAQLWGLQAGVSVLRVHDVAEARRANAVWEAISKA